MNLNNLSEILAEKLIDSATDKVWYLLTLIVWTFLAPLIVYYILQYVNVLPYSLSYWEIFFLRIAIKAMLPNVFIVRVKGVSL